MKTFDLEVTKQLSSTIRVTVPDDFDERKFRHVIYARLLRQVTDEQIDSLDWNDVSEEVEVDSVKRVEDNGKYETTDITARERTPDRRQQRSAAVRGSPPAQRGEVMAERNPIADDQRDLVRRLAASFERHGKMVLAESLTAVLAENDRLAKEAGPGAFQALQGENRGLRAENERLSEYLDGAGGCLSMVRDFLKAVGCECSADTHDATPPSCYPEWIACAMRAYAAKALREGKLPE